MENVKVKDPKDDQITNKDGSITNKNGDNYLEKGEQPADQRKPDNERAPTVVPNNENADPGPSPGDNLSDKDREFAKHNL